MLVQRSGSPLIETKRVFYQNGSVDLPVLPGYSVCYDIAESLVPQDDEFDEEVLGVSVVQPATANLGFFAGIVTAVGARKFPHSTTDFSGFVEIAVPRPDAIVRALALVDADPVVASNLPIRLQLTNGQFYLVAETFHLLTGTAGSETSSLNFMSLLTKAVALQTIDADPDVQRILVKLTGL